MKIRAAILTCITFLAACQSTPPVPDSGVEGLVTIGPMCSVVQEGVPCPDEPYQAVLTILSESGKKLQQFQTDESGRFRIELEPGEYVLHPESPGGLPFAADIPFSVEEHRFTGLEVRYDSGIR